MKRLLLAVCAFGLLLSSASAQEEPPAPNPELEPPQGQITPQNPSTLASWKSQILAVLDRKKLYPETSKLHGEQGAAQVLFSLDRQGRLVGSRIVRSSGSIALDEEALALVQRAQPFPPPPPEAFTRGDRVDLSLPVRFTIPQTNIAPGPEQVR